VHIECLVEWIAAQSTTSQSAIISVGHTDTKFYYQCGILTLNQQMAPHYCPKY